MKYDFLILSSLPKNSGCYLRAKYLATSLSQNGAKVKLIIPIISNSFLLAFTLNFFKYLFFIFITSYKYGIAIKPYPNTLFPLLLKKLISKNKIIVDIDDIDFGYRKGLMSTLSRWLQQPFPKYFDLVTYHNDLLKNFIIKEYKVSKEKLYILKQGVDFKIFNNKINHQSFKQEFIKQQSLNSKTKIIIYSAHLNIAADLDIVLQYLSGILQLNNFLIIAGGGPQLDEYKKMAQMFGLKNIFFTGYLSPEQIIQYILISDYALVFYKDIEVNYYRCSMKLREYLALKKKVICNNVGELKYFKKYTYQSNKNIESFITILKNLLIKKPKDNREQKGYFFIRDNFNWQNIGKDFLNYLKNNLY